MPYLLFVLSAVESNWWKQAEAWGREICKIWFTLGSASISGAAETNLSELNDIAIVLDHCEIKPNP